MQGSFRSVTAAVQVLDCAQIRPLDLDEQSPFMREREWGDPSLLLMARVAKLGAVVFYLGRPAGGDTWEMLWGTSRPDVWPVAGDQQRAVEDARRLLEAYLERPELEVVDLGTLYQALGVPRPVYGNGDFVAAPLPPRPPRVHGPVVRRPPPFLRRIS